MRRYGTALLDALTGELVTVLAVNAVWSTFGRSFRRALTLTDLSLAKY